MRRLPAFLTILLLSASPALASTAEDNKAPAQTDEAGSGQPEQTEGTKAPADVDWIKVESTGILTSSKSGALDKTLWKEQKRSEIEPLLAGLKTDISLRSVLSLQRRLLLSRTDTSLMNDDTGPARGNDLLIQRIRKLVDMGLYADAWELYTQKAADPYDVSIAQLGMLLLVMKSDTATACLEEKVFSARYSEDKFFDVLDRACNYTIGVAPKSGQFESSVLNAIYTNPSYSVAASAPDTLMKMDDMERALVMANGKIRYDGLNADIAAKTPSKLLGLYLLDKKLPPAALSLIKAETDKRGITRYTPSIAKDDKLIKAKSLYKALDEQWPVIESALAVPGNPADFWGYTTYLEDQQPTNLSTETTFKVIQVLLANGMALPDFWRDAALKLAPEKPLIYIYLQAFESLTPSPNVTVPAGDVQKAMDGLKEADRQQILAIFETLDKSGENVQKLLDVYEKHSDLTAGSNYVMPSAELNELLEKAPEQKQLGITVLAVLNTLYGKPDTLYPDTVRNALNSMLNMGLIEDANLIGAETVGSVLNKY